MGAKVTFAESDCDSPQTQMAMNVCSQNQFTQADKEMNDFYQAALKHLELNENSYDDKYKNKEFFMQNQRDWIKYRDDMCAFQAGEQKNSGTIWPLIVNTCMTNITVNRTEDIKNSFMETLDLDSIENKNGN